MSILESGEDEALRLWITFIVQKKGHIIYFQALRVARPDPERGTVMGI